MLIKSEEEYKSLGLVKHQTCTLCKKELFYPRIVLKDAPANSYHLACAVKLIEIISMDMCSFLEARDLPAMANSLHVQGMSKAYRAARSLDPADEAFWDEHWDERE